MIRRLLCLFMDHVWVLRVVEYSGFWTDEYNNPLRRKFRCARCGRTRIWRKRDERR